MRIYRSVHLILVCVACCCVRKFMEFIGLLLSAGACSACVMLLVSCTTLTLMNTWFCRHTDGRIATLHQTCASVVSTFFSLLAMRQTRGGTCSKTDQVHHVLVFFAGAFTEYTRCCAVLCCAVLCCAVLCCAVLCCARVLVDGVPFTTHTHGVGSVPLSRDVSHESYSICF